MRLILIHILVCVLAAAKAGGFEYVTTRGPGLGQTIVLSQPSASATLIVPSFALADRQGQVEIGAVRRFEMKDLDQGFVSAVYRVGKFTYSLGVTQFGYGDYYAERTAVTSVAYHMNRLAVGLKLSAIQLDFGGHYDNLSAGGVGLGFAYRTERIIIAAVADNVNWPSLDDSSEKIRPSYSLYTELVGRGAYVVTGKITLQDSEKPAFGVGQKIDLSSIAAVFWGVSTAPIIYGGGLELIYKRSLITYATSYHPTLGFSHTLAVGFKIGKRESVANDQSEKRGH